MNLLNEFLVEAHLQARSIVKEEFAFAAAPTVKFIGEFDVPQIVPVMTRQGYQDHLVTRMTAEASQWTSPAVPAAKVSIIRTLTGRTLFVQMVDYTDPVLFTFVLTDREL